MSESDRRGEAGEPERDEAVEAEIVDAEELELENERSQGGAEGEGPADPLSDLERERDEYLDLAKRTKAEFENFRRRMADEVAGAEIRGKTELAGSLIGVVDNLERALEAFSVTPAAAAAGEAEVEGSLEQGVVMTYRELCGVLERTGVEGYSPAGERFDPTWHEALQARPADDGTESGVVLEVIQKGYRLGDRVLRPARVIVAA